MHKDAVVKRCDELKRFWAPRNEKFKIWYRLIEMIDELKQSKMESFVGNDAQSSFKLLRHMISQKIPHRLPHEQITLENGGAAAELSKLFDKIWADINLRHRRKGRQGWTWDLTGYLLATGWYSVMSMVTQDGSRAVADILNPAIVFPMWDDDLTEVAHIETLNANSVKRICARNNWVMHDHWYNKMFTGSAKRLYDYWRMDDGGQVFNTIVLGNELVKEETYEARFNRIPIFVGAVGGLPDAGLITEDMEKWKAEVGQASVATNENIYRYFNKWWTFSQQLMRDTAQARIKEKSRGGKVIVKPEETNKRGVIWRMGTDEDVSFVTPPPMPVELRSSQLDMEAMIQRGGPSWAMYGTTPGSMTAYVMSQIAASTNQIADPYHHGVIDCTSDIDNSILHHIKNTKAKLHGVALPDGLPDDATLTTEYEIKIPGDLIQRVTVARMLDPDFRVSYRRVVEELFPEIKDSIQEKALIRADKAELHPINSMLDLVAGLRKTAKVLRAAGEIGDAALHEKAAASVEAQMGLAGEEQAQASPQQQRPTGGRREAAPPSIASEEGTIAPIA